MFSKLDLHVNGPLHHHMELQSRYVLDKNSLIFSKKDPNSWMNPSTFTGNIRLEVGKSQDTVRPTHTTWDTTRQMSYPAASYTVHCWKANLLFSTYHMQNTKSIVFRLTADLLTRACIQLRACVPISEPWSRGREDHTECYPPLQYTGEHKMPLRNSASLNN